MSVYNSKTKPAQGSGRPQRPWGRPAHRRAGDYRAPRRHFGGMRIFDLETRNGHVLHKSLTRQKKSEKTPQNSRGPRGSLGGGGEAGGTPWGTGVWPCENIGYMPTLVQFSVKGAICRRALNP